MSKLCDALHLQFLLDIRRGSQTGPAVSFCLKRVARHHIGRRSLSPVNSLPRLEPHEQDKKTVCKEKLCIQDRISSWALVLHHDNVQEVKLFIQFEASTMIYHNSLELLETCITTERKKLAVWLMSTFVAVLSTGVLCGQIRDETPTPKTASSNERKEIVGLIQEIEGINLKVEHDDREMPRIFMVSKSAKITLNRKLAMLSDLQINDFVRINTPADKPGLAVEITATRAVGDTPRSSQSEKSKLIKFNETKN